MKFDALETPVTSLGESPFWDSESGTLGFVDIPTGRLHIVRPDGSLVRTIGVGGALSAVVPVVQPQVGWLAAQGREVLTLTAGGALGALAADSPVTGAGVRLNDGKCDAAGRFWVGSMDLNGRRPFGSLYRIEADSTVTPMESGLTISNGLGWSPDHRFFYLIDTIPGVLFRWRFDLDNGELSDKTVLASHLGPGMPDGLAVDYDGCLWIAFCGGGRVARFSPGGAEIESYPTPVSQPTCPSFGGSDGKTLYVTSATMTLSREDLEREPAGRVLAASVDVGGPAPDRWAGGPTARR